MTVGTVDLQIESPNAKPSERGESGRLRFAVDTGGTFTDLIVADDSGDIEMFKAPTHAVRSGRRRARRRCASRRDASRRLARRISRARRHPRPRHDARDQRDRHGSNRANRLSDDGGPSRHAGLPRRRPAGRLQFHRALSRALRAQGADVRDPRAHPERRLGARAARRSARSSHSRARSRRCGVGGGRRLPAVVGRQSGARARDRRADRAPPAGRSVHAVASHQSVDPRISPRDVDRARRVAEAGDERLYERARGAHARRRFRRPHPGRHLAGRRDGRRRRRRGAGAPDQFRSEHGACRRQGLQPRRRRARR